MRWYPLEDIPHEVVPLQIIPRETISLRLSHWSVFHRMVSHERLSRRGSSIRRRVTGHQSRPLPPEPAVSRVF